MPEFLLAAGSALWLGVLTSISPCSLATNVAAISFLSKKVLHVNAVLLAGFAYTLGRMLVYAILGVLMIKSVLSIPAAAYFLQGNMNKILGPVLVVVGILLLDIVRFVMPGISLSCAREHRLADAGVWGALGLGALFALSFCPVSAALFFGSLIPLAFKSQGGALLPLFYGLGTGLPVLFFVVAMALGVKSLNQWFHMLTKLEFYIRYMTGIICILVGVYYIRIHLLGGN
ncbi:MAG: aromatic aminobenezylarsenical efflux permease ArsG family transporter [Candidatus Omnitrophota bacterium]